MLKAGVVAYMRNMQTNKNSGNLKLRLALAAAGAAAGVAVALVRRSRKIEISGKNVLITGGSRGLGLVLAREFARRGARVAICARNEDELERVRQEFSLMGDPFLALRCDIRRQDEIENLVRTVQQEWGYIDILVNNAGIVNVGPVENMTAADFENAMKSNFWGAVYASLAVTPQMKERGFGRIVNISSIGGKIAVPHLLPYTASKFALAGFSQGLRAELAKDGIAVTTIYPGLMRTGSPRNADFKGQHQLEHTWFIISDSLPASSISAKRAARHIIRACAEGRSEAVLGLPAKLAVTVQRMMPGGISEIMGAVNRWLLPAPSEFETGIKKGFESDTALTRSPLTRLTRAAERANNQL